MIIRDELRNGISTNTFLTLWRVIGKSRESLEGLVDEGGATGVAWVVGQAREWWW